MGLKIDTEKVRVKLIQLLRVEINEALEHWKTDVIAKMGNYYFKNKAVVDKRIEVEGNVVKAFLEANNYVLADSYGTGSLMQTAENPGFDEFKSQYWHSERKSNAIYGRAKGSYESVFGGTHKSSGRYSEKNLEGKRFGKIKIQPSPPSGAIKISEEMLMKQWLPIAYSNVKKKIKLSDFIVKS